MVTIVFKQREYVDMVTIVFKQRIRRHGYDCLQTEENT